MGRGHCWASVRMIEAQPQSVATDYDGDILWIHTCYLDSRHPRETQCFLCIISDSIFGIAARSIFSRLGFLG